MRKTSRRVAASRAMRRPYLKRALARCVIAYLRVMARIPLRAARALGACIGLVAWLLKARPARVTAFNIDTCLPRLSPGQRRELCRRSLIETGRLIGEMGLAWHGKADAFERSVRIVEGAELVDTLAAGGTLVLMPHFGNWEIMAYVFGPSRMTCLYAPPGIPGLEDEMNRARSRWGLNMVPLGLGGLRAVKRALEKGGVAGLLPDQTPPPEAGVLAPFFGREALTMTLARRLVTERTRVILSTAQRVSGGWEVRHVRVDDRIRDPDPVASATVLNAAIESAALRDPAQYQWEYNRFRHPIR